MTEPVVTVKEPVNRAPPPRRRPGVNVAVVLPLPGGGHRPRVALCTPIAMGDRAFAGAARPHGAGAVGRRLTHLTVSNYSTLLVTDNVLINLLNSLIAALGTAALTVVVSTMAGYGLARFSFRFAGLVFAAILLAFMIPFQAVLTPLFLELHFFHLLNSLFGLVLVYSTFSLPFGVFAMRNTFSQIPGELVDSSRVDGAGVITALVRVMRPLVIPGMATTAIYAFLLRVDRVAARRTRSLPATT